MSLQKSNAEEFNRRLLYFIYQLRGNFEPET